jgi:DNA-binding response OmpR family regulator
MDQKVAGTAKIILVVDADNGRREYTQKILSSAGYTVLTATNVADAEALAETDQIIDLVICSVVLGLGGDSGVHLAEHIERSKRTNSTLLVSHYSRELLRHIPGFARQRHFLSNPFDSQELLHRVHDLLVRPRP